MRRKRKRKVRMAICYKNWYLKKWQLNYKNLCKTYTSFMKFDMKNSTKKLQYCPISSCKVVELVEGKFFF